MDTKMKTENNWTPDEYRTIKEYADTQKLSVAEFIRSLVLKAVAPHEEAE